MRRAQYVETAAGVGVFGVGLLLGSVLVGLPEPEVRQVYVDREVEVVRFRDSPPVVIETPATCPDYVVLSDAEAWAYAERKR